MSKTVGPIIATGIVAEVNLTVFNGHPFNWKIPIATALAAVGFDLVERIWPIGAELLAWTSLITVLMTRINPAVPSVTESALAWFNTSVKATS